MYPSYIEPNNHCIILTGIVHRTIVKLYDKGKSGRTIRAGRNLSAFLILSSLLLPFGFLGDTSDVRAQTPTADFNGDGFADLAIDVPFEDIGIILQLLIDRIDYLSASVTM